MRLLDRAWTDPKTRADFNMVQITVDPHNLDRRRVKPIDVSDLLIPFEITPIARYYDRHYPDFATGTVNWNEIVDQLRPPHQMTFLEYVREPGAFKDLHPSIETVGVLLNLSPPDDAQQHEISANFFREMTQRSAANMWKIMVKEGKIVALAEPDWKDIAYELEYEIFVLHDRVRVSRVSKGNLYLRNDSRPFMVRYGPDRQSVPLQFFSQYDDSTHLMNKMSQHALLNPALLAISMLNTRNVSAVQLPAQELPPKVAEKRRKKTGRDPFVYKTLSITPMGSGSRRGGATRESSESDAKRLHIARGHFKHFTATAPLFGKHTGTYWWNSQVRGSIDAGVVSKDYRINEPKQGA